MGGSTHSAPRLPVPSWPVLIPLLLVLPSSAGAVNVTALLAGFRDLSDFTRLLTSTSVAADLADRSSLTLLAVPNVFLRRSELAARSPDIADVLRYHVLLEYLSPADLRRLPASGNLVTTLYQTTGRAAANFGAVNLTAGDAAGGPVAVRSPVAFSPSNATILGLITTLPYNVSVFAVDGLLVPYGFDLAASESRKPEVAVNITRVLVEARGFNVAATMLEASGVAAELEDDERGAGVTAFVPTDDAFAGLPATERLQSLPAQRKAAVLRFHVLRSYYPLGSLESIVNPMQPTLATDDTGAGRFTLNITRVNGSVAIDTGVVQAAITRTVFDQNPVAVFAVSRVLLPKEIFGGGGGGGEEQGSGAAPAEVEGVAPEGAEDAVETPPTRLSTPPVARGKIWSGAAADRRRAGAMAGYCAALVYLL